MQAPIGPATTPALVAAVSNAGALGTLAASWTDVAVLKSQLRELRESAALGFCVNLVLAFDQHERLDAVLAGGARYVSFSWGVDPGLVSKAREAGAFVLVQVGGLADAEQAAAAGADGLISQGVEAGGHVQGEAPLLELLSVLRPVVDLPLLAAGGIGDAASAKAALDAGAHGVACGTAFLAASEADVHPRYLESLFRADASDTVLTTVFDVGWPNAPHRVLRNDTYDDWDSSGRPHGGLRPGDGEVIATRAGIPIMRYSEAQPTSGTTGRVESMALYAGTSVRSVRHSASAKEIVRSIARDLPKSRNIR
jgi:nitronate monooxygenase